MPDYSSVLCLLLDIEALVAAANRALLEGSGTSDQSYSANHTYQTVAMSLLDLALPRIVEVNNVLDIHATDFSASDFTSSAQGS